jgi:hypothetical protein
VGKLEDGGCKCRNSSNPAAGAGTPEACEPSGPRVCGVHKRPDGT